MNVYEQWAQDILRKSGETAAKAAMVTATMSAASVVELDWVQATTLYGNDETPIISKIGKTTSKAITHRWREATARAAASNTNNENAAAKAPVSVAPAAKTNTCQIVKGTIGVSDSAIQEAANGIYGSDAIDYIAMQLELETRGILKDIEYSVLFGVESTSDARMMNGLVGAVGTWGGVIQTTRKDLSDAAFSETYFNAFLNDIWEQQAGVYPDTVYCSLAATQTVNAFTTNYRQNVVTAGDLANLPAGTRVTKFIAPWGGVVDIVPHPLCTNSATSANNWMLAVRSDLIKLADFRPLKVRKVVATDADGEEWELVWEGTLECKIEKAHGILRNFDQIV